MNHLISGENIIESDDHFDTLNPTDATVHLGLACY